MQPISGQISSAGSAVKMAISERLRQSLQQVCIAVLVSIHSSVPPKVTVMRCADAVHEHDVLVCIMQDLVIRPNLQQALSECLVEAVSRRPVDKPLWPMQLSPGNVRQQRHYHLRSQLGYHHAQLTCQIILAGTASRHAPIGHAWAGQLSSQAVGQICTPCGLHGQAYAFGNAATCPDDPVLMAARGKHAVAAPSQLIVAIVKAARTIDAVITTSVQIVDFCVAGHPLMHSVG